MSGLSVRDFDGIEKVREHLENTFAEYDDYEELSWELTRYDAPYNGVTVSVQDDGGDIRIFTLTIKEETL